MHGLTPGEHTNGEFKHCRLGDAQLVRHGDDQTFGFWTETHTCVQFGFHGGEYNTPCDTMLPKQPFPLLLLWSKRPFLSGLNAGAPMPQNLGDPDKQLKTALGQGTLPIVHGIGVG